MSSIAARHVPASADSETSIAKASAAVGDIAVTTTDLAAGVQEIRRSVVEQARGFEQLTASAVDVSRANAAAAEAATRMLDQALAAGDAPSTKGEGLDVLRARYLGLAQRSAAGEVFYPTFWD